MASKVLRAQITIDDYQTSIMDKASLKEYVINNLLDQMRTSLKNEMIIQNVGNPNVGTSTYTGTLYTGSTITSSNIGANTISANSLSNYSQINLRVVEYTKNGKTTRVELQKYDESNDSWVKIPRVKIEE